ncbi:MAG: Unknown protein [uncultured Sulfurovum sp.]|uniref:HNH domain-containing protein n=1 Tax=uncultured Sulfurovum sp. TaxID=269237 RepID=A0A6S6RWP7_9BACT|nr:MAG: Unknown protein [uncultured Sulfurovum sp.]
MNAVKYEGDIKDTVDAYNALNKNSQSGNYWDKTDAGIPEVKKHIKDHYKKVQEHTCVYCQQKIVVEHAMAWDIEHIIPKTPYPQFLFTEENLAVSCKDCNLIKFDKNVLKNPKRKRFPKKSEDYIISHPHYDEYDEHIHIIADKLYRPKDAKGEKTIEVCGLLRFAYKYTDYGETNEDIEITKQIVKLGKELISASNATETAFIIDCLKDLKDFREKKSRDIYLKSLLK